MKETSERSPSRPTSPTSSTSPTSPNSNDKPKESGQWTTASSKQAIRPALLAILLSIVLYIGERQLSKSSLPNPDTYEPTPETPFNLTNALHHINHIGQNPRFVGTRALTTSLQYIQTHLHTLRPLAERNNLHLDIDFFQSQPSSFMTYIRKFNMRHSYNHISSVIARLRPSNIPHNSSAPSLLINAHVDSAVSAPGANDNVVAVGLVMDVIRAFASMNERELNLQRPIIFLFNGAEEVGLQGAHSFVTQHAWRHNIAAHINLESIGSGSAYFLFRLGPDAPWLAHAYANSVTHPFGSVCATDVFNAEIIPAETDFLVFDKIANIPGFDLALVDHGYIYHTAFDDVHHVDRQGVLHGGITVLQLARHLAGGPDAIGRHLSNPLQHIPSSSVILSRLAGFFEAVLSARRAQVVFFDVGRRFMVVYSEILATVFHLAVVAAAGAVWAGKFFQWSPADRFSSLRMCGILLACLFAAFASATFASVLYAEVFQARLVWYGSLAKAFVAFCPSIAFGVFSMLSFLLPKRMPTRRFEHMLFAVTLFYTVFVLLCIWFGFMMAYIPSLIVLVLIACALQGERVSPLGKHLQIMLVFSGVCTNVMMVTLSVILPLMGRVRTTILPHDTIAALLIAFSCVVYAIVPALPILCHYAMGLRRLKRISFALAGLVALWFLVVAPRVNESRLYTPYSTAAPKRSFMVHFHAPQMDPPSVLYLSALGPGELDIERLARPLVKSDEDIGSLPGVPQFGTFNCTPLEAFGPYVYFLQHVTVLRSGRVPDLALPSLDIVSEERTERGWNVSFLAKAPDSHAITFRFDVREGGVVKGWSFDSPMRDAAKRNSDGWVKHHGSTQADFWLLLRDDGDADGSADGSGGDVRPKVTVLVCSARLGYSRSPHDLALLKFHEWESPAAAVSVGREVTL